MAIFGFQLANALLLGGDGLADTAQAGLLGFNLAEPAPDNTLHEAHVLANLLETQALDFDHLNDLQFEACVKASSGILILHVLCHLGSWKNLSLCPFKLNNHTFTLLCPAVATPAHRTCDAALLERVYEGIAGVLTPPH